MFRNLPFAIHRLRWVGLFLFLILGNAAFGEGDDWFARPWQTDDGLPDNIVMGVGQTPDGFLWVITQQSILRFDGAQFREFSPFDIPGVSERSIRCMAVAKDGKLWLGLNDGSVVWINSDQSHVLTAKDGLPETRVRTMFEDGEGSMWLNYPNHGGVARIKGDKVDVFDTSAGLPAADPCRLTVDVKGELWFAKGRDLGVFRKGRFQTLTAMDVRATTLAGARGGGVWIATTGQLMRYKEGGKIESVATLPQPGATQGNLMEDSAGGVWVANSIENGLFRFNGHNFETIPVSHPAITSLAEDREGNVWVGTVGGGLNRLRPRALELLNTENGRPFQSVRSVTKDADGFLWVATSDGALLHQREQGWDAVTGMTNWPGGRADCIAVDRSGALWIGTRYNGLYRLQNNQYTVWNEKNNFTNHFIRSLVPASNGDLWVTTDLPNEMCRLRDSQLQEFAVPSKTRLLRAGAEDSKGNIWFGTADGNLLRVTDQGVQDVTTNDLSRPVSIRSMHATEDGSIWIGYSGYGIGRLKDGKYTRITTTEGLDDNFISQISSDGLGGLWLAGTHGLFRVSLSELNAVAENRAQRVRSVLYGRSEGVPNVQGYYDSSPDAVRGKDGRLYIGTRTGLAVVYPEHIAENAYPPPVVLEDVIVDGKTQASYDSGSPLVGDEGENLLNLRSRKGELVLPPGPHKVEFQYAALSYTAPQSVEFRYRLEGVDEDWIKGGTERSVSYSRLTAGKYSFHVLACNNSGVWNETGAAMSFKIAPFIWQTWWFRVSVLAAFTMSLIAIVRYVSYRRLQNQLRFVEQQAAVERERMRIARDIHDDLGDRLTTVAMLSGLALRNRNGDGPDEKHLEQISTTARQATDALDEIVWAVNPRNDVLPNVVDYVGQFAVEFLRTANIQCRLDLPDHPPLQPVSAEARHNLFLSVKEALNNVARHSGATEVKLSLVASDTSCTVTVEDNGRGFAQKPAANGADGLQNMRQRMSEIGGRFELESQPGKGTRVTLEFPWLNQKQSQPG